MLDSGYFPHTWKCALVRPLLKKDGLPPVFKNFRPVSNLAFISKLVETVVAKQLQHYLNCNNLFPVFQSAYRQNHSTETALLKVMNDILLNMNNQCVTLLILQDLSAAFDTIVLLITTPCSVDLNTHLVYREKPSPGLHPICLEELSG